MAEVTGYPIEELPRRVFRLQLSRVLSEWLGRSEKNIDEFFDEIEELASEPWISPGGKEFSLPVLVILEEIDGLAQTRGGDNVYDRILTGVLQRLDPNRGIGNKFAVFIGTTNEPDKVDGAMLRRIGSSTEKLRRLDRKGFITVLRKQIADRPVQHGLNGESREAVVRDLAAWLFSANGSDPGIIELNYVGSTKPEKRYRRDFLTGALVNRAVLRAAEKAAREACAGHNGAGIHLEHFVEALDFQIRATADMISEHNAARFVEIPDSVRVASVRQLPQPDLFPLQLRQ
jgi:SpoVK/Ycf46/Vps4 family AAA+-type ATPase